MSLFPISKIPLNISANGCYLSPDKLNGADASLPADDSLIASWKDISGFGNNADHGVTSEQPTFKTAGLEDKAGVLFDALNSILTIAVNYRVDDLFAAGGFFICVIKPLSDGENDQGRLFSQGGGNLFINLQNESAGFCKISLTKGFSTTGGTWVSTNSPIVINQKNIVAVSYNASSVSNDPAIYVNSLTPEALTESSTPVGTQTASAPTILGNNTTALRSRTFDGYFGDMIFYKKTCSSTEINDLITSLANKYGVSIS